MAECEGVAPALAARQYIRYRDLGIPVDIEFTCGEKTADADTPMYLPQGMIMGYPYTY